MVECRTFWRRGVRRTFWRREVRREVPLERLATFPVVPSTMGISLTAPVDCQARPLPDRARAFKPDQAHSDPTFERQPHPWAGPARMVEG